MAAKDLKSLMKSPFTSAGPIRSLEVYRHMGTWVFDAPEFLLEKEPFVEGAERWIDVMVVIATCGHNWAQVERCTLLFSMESFEGDQLHLEHLGKQPGPIEHAGDNYGDWYAAVECGGQEAPLKGWLCPALRHYFPEGSPKNLYAAVKL